MKNPDIDFADLGRRIEFALMEKIGRKFPLQLKWDYDYGSTILVYVFNVDDACVEMVDDLIYDLEKKLYPDRGIMLLGMIKNVAVTQEYYPEMLPRCSMDAVLFPDSFIFAEADERESMISYQINSGTVDSSATQLAGIKAA